MLSRSCMLKMRFMGTLLNMPIFCITFSPTGLVARQAITCGCTPLSMSRLMPSCAAFDFCSPSVAGSRM